ncbi:MAG TPA: DUF2059 domain-containing protein [Opitutaceae bacterium]|nr:DUF2059 domain-containing protein [Opitutaceae bacterium]
MKLLLSLLLCLSVSSLGRADEASHRAAALKILDIASGPELMRTAFLAGFDPFIKGLHAKGIPDNVAAEFREAIVQWFDQEIKWDDIKPRIAELYMQEFTEEELTAIAAFYQTPAGQKALVKLPSLMQQSAKIGQDYATTKQASLQQKLQQIAEKYTLVPKPAAAPAAAP